MTLVIMAAGMGSRYGGLKQLEVMDSYGHRLIDYSIYDAILAGFDRVVFIIRREIEDEFRRNIGDRLTKIGLKIDYVYQEINILPNGAIVPENRTKPWGTAQAVACLDGTVSSPFALINADDYYGRNAFLKINDFLLSGSSEWATVCFSLKNTLSENGGVSRGLCKTKSGYLEEICETHGIHRADGKIISEDGNELAPTTLTSMNFWGLLPEAIEDCKRGFADFFETRFKKDPRNCEFYLTDVISRVLSERQVKIRVLETGDDWLGVTNRGDKNHVKKRLDLLITEGKYPENF